MRVGTLTAFVILLVTNIATADVLDRYLEFEKSQVTTKSLGAADRSRLYHRVESHPVASLEVIDKYDTPKGEIGFCFGRAMAAHLLARKMGLDDASIRKLFVVGDLRGTDGSLWRFHVTTLVLGDKDEWFAIDPVMGQPLTVKQWIDGVTRGWDPKKKALYYNVPSHVVVPDIRTVPDVKDETGEHVIELSFDPNDHKGFKEFKVKDRKVYEVDETSSEEYFLVARPNLETTFDFLGITINGGHFPYKGYFEDLLADLNRPGFREARKLVRALAEPEFKLKTKNLYGFRVPGQ